MFDTVPAAGIEQMPLERGFTLPPSLVVADLRAWLAEGRRKYAHMIHAANMKIN